MHKLVANRKQFEVDALELYGFAKVEGDERATKLVIEECYLDF